MLDKNFISVNSAEPSVVLKTASLLPHRDPISSIKFCNNLSNILKKRRIKAHE